MVVKSEDVSPGVERSPVVIPILTLKQRIGNLENEHDRLEDKDYLRKRYRQPALAALIVGIILLYGAMGLGVTLLSSSRYLAFAVAMGVGGAISLLLIIPLGRRGRNYRLTADESLVIDAYHVVADLSACLKEEVPLPHYRREAEKNLVGLSERLEESWTVGPYRLAALTLAPLSKFKKSLREGLIPAVAKGTREELEFSQVVMVDFCEYLLKKEPTLQDVDALNEKIKSLYGHTKERSWYIRLLHLAKSYIRLRTLVPGGIALASGWVLFNLLMFDGFSKEAALTPSVETSLGFTSIYVGWLGVQSYLKRKPVD